MNNNLRATPIELTITDTIRKIGIPANLKGYRYIRDAVMITICEPELRIVSQLYPAIAKKNNTTPSRVERAIRSAIEKAWKCGNINELQRIFGYTVSPHTGRPTNAQFIYTLADDYILQMGKAGNFPKEHEDVSRLVQLINKEVAHDGRGEKAVSCL